MLCTFFEKNMYVECTKLLTFFEKLCVECIELCAFFEKLYMLKYTKLCTSFEKLCTLNTQNWVHFLKNYVH